MDRGLVPENMYVPSFLRPSGFTEGANPVKHPCVWTPIVLSRRTSGDKLRARRQPTILSGDTGRELTGDHPTQSELQVLDSEKERTILNRLRY